MQFLLALALIIVIAKAMGFISTRLGQPGVLGELLEGLVLGPSVLDMLHQPIFRSAHVGETLQQLAQVGVLLLMFIAGLEVHLKTMARAAAGRV